MTGRLVKTDHCHGDGDGGDGMVIVIVMVVLMGMVRVMMAMMVRVSDDGHVVWLMACGECDECDGVTCLVGSN